MKYFVNKTQQISGKILNRKPPSSPRLLNEIRMTKRSTIVAKAGSRVRSASTGRDKKSGKLKMKLSSSLNL